MFIHLCVSEEKHSPVRSIAQPSDRYFDGHSPDTHGFVPFSDLKSDVNNTCVMSAKCNNAKLCLTSLLITSWFSNLSMNLNNILVRTEVLHLNSQVLFHLVKCFSKFILHTHLFKNF